MDDSSQNPNNNLVKPEVVAPAQTVAPLQTVVTTPIQTLPNPIVNASQTGLPPSPVTQSVPQQNIPSPPIVGSQAVPVSQPVNKSNAISLVLQWLSYGLWEWTLISLSILLSSTLSYYFITRTRSENYSWLAYVVASTLVLLPISYVMDKFYSKKEPQHKQGFAAVIMVLNAVFVFLSFIAGLITCVVSAMTLMLSASASNSTYIVVVSSLVVSVLSLLLFLRIMHFEKIPKFSRFFPIIIVIIAGATAVAALAGPFRAEVGLKGDRLIEENLPALNTDIQDYAQKNNKLPDSLSDLDLSASYQQDAQQLINKSLVTYTKSITTSSVSINPTVSPYNTTTRYTTSPSTGNYELCVVYKKERKLSSSYSSLASSKTYIDTSNHGSGKQCYQQTVTFYNNTIN